MKNRKPNLASTAVALVMLFVPGLVSAQSWKSTCMSTGASAAEPLGDREGHAIQVSSGTCRIEGGPLDGAVMTQNTIWEADKATSTVLSGDGTQRKPGATAAYRLTAGTLNPIMQDGKPIGWAASGKGLFTLGIGSAASLTGKSYSWTARSTGNRTYSIETSMD
jgi:hypothetical protein